ncbi:hypothetical protein MJS38_17585, partial [Burkholderia gladioli]|nr:MULTISPECIES: DUF2191 domain-containing protein [Burkholderia]MCH7270225.1 type II toxin-antitoxin system VapB family antitoxin [Burkholderia gladioli]MDN7737836.1 type II toxin-antitoxin system VapB family antitoxin [Burkholderia gladioli]MDN7803895.1 type II toxin-antitoxin system VapB family antitoxin [Burkholderia gladioli]MDN7919476.1 type II toxin-antitoxin system VapB family antitoxin [Burkholderia gladioli]MDN8062440.1 type II toxin-antitoxin system VapB family antitoxin [Burkholder
MRITVTIDDDLYTIALSMADPGMNTAALLQEAMETFARVRAAQRLALASSNASWITGTVLPVDGGVMAGRQG